MNGFKSQQFTRIKDLSDKRRLPRLGKIRLGVKAISAKTKKEYPKETEYFVCPPEIRKIYGDHPKELDIMVPINDLDVVFPQRLVWFGSSRGIKCIGNGETALRIEEPDGARYEEMKERECPCELYENKEPRLRCMKRASFYAMLPKVSVAGIYQIDLGSYHSIIDLNSGLDYVQALVGRFAMVPLVLRRVPRETHGAGSKQTHFTLQVFLDATDINFINTLRESTNRILAGPKYALPAPEIINPVMDDGATIVEVEEEETDGHTSPPEESMPAQETGLPTPEEEQKLLKERGMIPKAENGKVNGNGNRPEKIEAWLKNISDYTDPNALSKWFGDLKKKEKFSMEEIAILAKKMNNRLLELTRGK